MREVESQGHCLRFEEEGDMTEWCSEEKKANEMMSWHRDATDLGKKKTRGLVGKKGSGFGRMKMGG